MKWRDSLHFCMDKYFILKKKTSFSVITNQIGIFQGDKQLNACISIIYLSIVSEIVLAPKLISFLIYALRQTFFSSVNIKRKAINRIFLIKCLFIHYIQCTYLLSFICLMLFCTHLTG